MSDFPDQVLKEHDREVEPTATQSVDVLGPPREEFFERADEGVLDAPVSIAPPPVLATPEIVEPEPVVTAERAVDVTHHDRPSPGKVEHQLQVHCFRWIDSIR